MQGACGEDRHALSTLASTELLFGATQCACCTKQSTRATLKCSEHFDCACRNCSPGCRGLIGILPWYNLKLSRAVGMELWLHGTTCVLHIPPVKRCTQPTSSLTDVSQMSQPKGWDMLSQPVHNPACYTWLRMVHASAGTNRSQCKSGKLCPCTSPGQVPSGSRRCDGMICA